MLLCVTLLLLLGLSACTVAGDKELAVNAEVGSWVAVTLEVDVIPSILLQLRDVKKGKASQFFGLMGKQEYLPSSQREQVISENQWSRGEEEQLQKAKRLRTTGQSESHQPRLPEDETPLLTWTWQPTSRPGQPSAPCLLCSCVPPTTLNSLDSSQDSRSQAAVVHKCAVVTSES
ncbi:tachykinin-4 isoform X2 [Bos javanicus]|uniref:tachykinin-4 isoform X2 n=1 Tax=Bos javanicus TaxID=9906 RepID=UPI002AA82C9B|nr:tachykinin-4 isoform X2 [Bos javanicus]